MDYPEELYPEGFEREVLASDFVEAGEDIVIFELSAEDGYWEENILIRLPDGRICGWGDWFFLPLWPTERVLWIAPEKLTLDELISMLESVPEVLSFGDLISLGFKPEIYSFVEKMGSKFMHNGKGFQVYRLMDGKYFVDGDIFPCIESYGHVGCWYEVYFVTSTDYNVDKFVKKIEKYMENYSYKYPYVATLEYNNCKRVWRSKGE